MAVRDLERSVGFYEDLGFEVFGRWSRSESYVQKVVGYYPNVGAPDRGDEHPGSSVGLELLEYRNAEGTAIDPANGNPGTAHFCLFVDDIDDLCARMAELVAGFVSPVQTSDAGPIKGGKVVYMVDPDGIRVELVELPKEGATDDATG